MRIPRYNNGYTKWNLLGLAMFVAVLFGGFALQFAGDNAERADAADRRYRRVECWDVSGNG